MMNTPAYALVRTLPRRSALRILVTIVAAASLAGAWHAAAQTPPSHGYTFYVAPHSHIDVVWYWTYEKTAVVSIDILNHALDLFHRDPRYTFTQDQMMAIEPFWNSLPASEKEFLRRMVREGRLELATGQYLQPDEAESDFESLVRQFYPALSWMENTFSTKVSTAWNVDTYGHTPQMPQLFRKAGLSNFVFMRDVLPSLQASVKSPFYWEGPDGSKILSYWLSGSYSLDWRGMGENIRRFVEHGAPGVSDILLPYGGDLYLPTETTAQIETKIRDAAGNAGVPIKKVVFCTPSQYFEIVQKSGVELPTYRNDFNPALFIQDLRGLYGERPNTKIANRRAEYMLESAEKLSSVASRFGQEYPAEKLHTAWLQVIFNQDHDALPGSHIDPVDEEMMSRYGGAIEAGRSALADAMYRMSRNVNTSAGKHYPFLVFNPLSFPRTEAVRYTPLFKEQITNFRLLDDAGNSVPFRTDFAGRREPNKPLSMAAIEFVARDIPPMGHRLYQLEPLEGTIQLGKPGQPEEQVSNRFFTVGIDWKTGGIRSIVSRETGEELLQAGTYQGNELVLEEENDPDMEGMLHFSGSEVSMKQYPVDSMTETHDAIGIRVRLGGPFLSGRRLQEICLYDEIPRIDFKTELQGFPGHDGLLTAVFPLRSGGSTTWNHETHNAVTSRPDGIYYAQTFVDAQRSGSGVAFLNRGMGGVQAEGSVIRLLLLRSITNYRGYYSPKASEAGSHTFEYSLYAHSGDWRNGVVQQAHSFGSPLLPFATDAHPGSLPSHHSFVTVEDGQFEITALKRSEDGKSLILRGHEIMGKKGRVTVAFDHAPAQAWLADLREHPNQGVPVENGKIQFECNPFEFVTLRLDAKP
jgi:alpha-mannosidase